MGLAHRVIPVLLYRDGLLVKGEKFDTSRVVGNALQAAMIHQTRGVDELIMIDVGATPRGRAPDFEFVRRLTDKCFMPITVGGGVRTVEDVQRLLDNGADKVLIGASAISDPHLVRDCTQHFGNQAIVVSVDFLCGSLMTRCGCGVVPAETTLSHFVQKMVKDGAGELLVQSVEYDGRMCGYDYGLIHEISHSVPVPVIASCGAGSYHHMLQAINAGASAVAAGAMFQWTDQTPKGAARYLQSHGVEARV